MRGPLSARKVPTTRIRITSSVGDRWPGEIAEYDIHCARWLIEHGYAEELTTTEQAEIITAPIRR